MPILLRLLPSTVAVCEVVWCLIQQFRPGGPTRGVYSSVKGSESLAQPRALEGGVSVLLAGADWPLRRSGTP